MTEPTSHEPTPLRPLTTHSSPQQSPQQSPPGFPEIHVRKHGSRTSSASSTPLKKMISSSRVSSGVNCSSVFNTPTRPSTPNLPRKAPVASPSRSSVRSDRATRHRHLLHHHRKLRNMPSKLDMLDTGFTSFPIAPPEVGHDQDHSPDHGPGSKRSPADPSMILVEDYIEENKRFLAFNPRKSKKMSVADFKKTLRHQPSPRFLGDSPACSAASDISMLIKSRRKGSPELDTLETQFSIYGQRNLVPQAPSTYSSTMTNATTVRDDSFGSSVIVNPDIHEASSMSTAIETALHEPADADQRSDDTTCDAGPDADGNRCVICETDLHDIPASACFKELVCFGCTEQYERVVNLINSDAIQDADDDVDSINDYDSVDLQGARPMDWGPSYEQPATKRQCNDFDNVLADNVTICNADPADQSTDNFARLYRSLKQIQEKDSRALAQAHSRHAFHNPLLTVRKPIFDFSATPALVNLPPPTATPSRVRPIFSIDNLKETFDKFRKLTMKDETSAGDDLWIRAKRNFNCHRQRANANGQTDDEDNETYRRWA